MFRFLALLLALFALVGCAAQMEAVRIAEVSGKARSIYKDCMLPVETDPKYAPLYEKLGFATTSDLNRSPSQAQLADNKRISDDDIALGLNWFAELQDCDLALFESLFTVAPEYQIYFANNQIEEADIINEIVTTKPTFGHINQRVLAFQLRRKEAGKRIAPKMRARLAAEQQQETEAIAAVATELALNVIVALATKQTNLAKSQRAFVANNVRYANQMKKIRVIKCNPVGRAYSCVLN